MVMRRATHYLLSRRTPVIHHRIIPCRCFANASSPAHPTPSLPRSIVLTTTGPDQAGIVHSLTSHLSSLSANIEESRMAILGSDFAVILRLTVPPTVTADALIEDLRKLFPKNQVTARMSDEEQTAVARQFPQPMRILSLTVSGPDQPNIVKQLTQIIVNAPRFYSRS